MNLANKGSRHQIYKCVEECGELIQILMKYAEDEPSTEIVDRVEEEIADVLITLESLKMVFNIRNINKWKKYKIERLKNSN